MFSRTFKSLSNVLLKIELHGSRTSYAFASTQTNALEDTKGTATFDFSKFKLHRLEEGPATTGKLSRSEALRIYRQVVVAVVVSSLD